MVAFVGVGLITPAFAGNPYTISVSAPDSVIEGNDFGFAVIIDNAGNDMSGWSFGICTDIAEMSINAFGPASGSDALNGGAGGDFVTNTIYVDGSGCSQAMVISFLGSDVLDAGTLGFEAATLECTAVGAAESDACMAVCSTLGSPPVATVVVVDGGTSVTPEFVDDCTAIIAPPPALDYRRGDSNDDGIVNIADIIWLLSELFLSGPATDCVGADDSNSDGLVDAADAVYTANMLFLAGPDPAAPYPDCGVDGDPDVDTFANDDRIGFPRRVEFRVLFQCASNDANEQVLVTGGALPTLVGGDLEALAQLDEFGRVRFCRQRDRRRRIMAGRHPFSRQASHL